MDNLNAVETRLRRLFEHVGEQVPDTPEESWADVERWDAEIDQMLAATPPPKRSRLIVGGVLTAALLGGTTGAAAAENWFQPAQKVPETVSEATSTLGSANPQSKTGATLQLTAPGPDGTVLRVVSALGDNTAYSVGECDTLTISLPDGSPAPGTPSPNQVGCSMISSPSTPLTPAQQIPGAGQGVLEWTSPAGTRFDFVYGDTDPGTVAVALTNPSGVVGAKVSTTDKGWFVVYETAPKNGRFCNITFTAPPGRPTRCRV